MSKPLQSTEVFTPGSFPKHTYVERAQEGLETRLRQALATKGMVVSLVGPSKSGKTVLVEKVVGRDNLITITGAGIQSPDQLWGRVLDWMNAPRTTTQASTTGTKILGEGSTTGRADIPLIGGIQGTAKLGTELNNQSTSSSTHDRSGLSQVVKEIGESEFTVLLDDFHYMPVEAQKESAKSIKEAVRLGVRVCTASVVHRGDEIVRSNPELRGRTVSVDMQYWRQEDLVAIGAVGFDKLNFEVDPQSLQQLSVEAAGSPQLMQSLCLQTCFLLNIEHRQQARASVKLDKQQVETILHRTAATTDFRSLVDVLDDGPRTRGMERKLYSFRDTTQGDVYRCILKAVAADPPCLSFDYNELTRRTHNVCARESPPGASITSTCTHMSKLAIEKFPNERAIDWDENKQVLDVPDPYLLFYLRWSGRLLASNN